MALFNSKDDTEEPKKGLISVVQYEGGNDTFVYKHPLENFTLGSQLIVRESQEAVFFRDGRALDLFGAGRYTLDVEKLPILGDVYKLATASEDFFQSSVYFVNMTTQMGIKWGTDSKVRLFDPASGLHIEIGAYGSFNLRVANSRKLLVKLVGTEKGLFQNDIVGVKDGMGKFKSLVMTTVKTTLANTIKENNINILEIDSYLDTLSETLRVKINPVLDDYGLTMPEFYVTNITLPNDDPNFRRLREQFAERTLKVRQEEILQAEAEAAYNRKMVQAQTDADLLKVKAAAQAEAYKMQAQAEAAEMQMKGYTYQQETARQVGMQAMKNGITGNGGASGGIGEVAGLGVALGAMGGVMNMTKNVLDPTLSASADIGAAAVPNTALDTWDCTCGNKGITANFCPNCGSKRPEQADTWDCACGSKGNTTNFCPNCGSKRPEQPKPWDCACGSKGNTTNFCPNCGSKRPEQPKPWDCTCGNKDITGNFCPNCGKKRGE